MRSTAPMKTAKIGYLVVSAVFCIMGIFLICRPDLGANLIGTIAGIVFLVFGAVKLVGYFSRDLYRLAFQYDLAFGILLLVVGVVLLTHPSDLMRFVSIVLGILALADGLFKIQIAVDSRKFGLRGWWIVMASAIAVAVLGALLLICNLISAKILCVLLGITFLGEGILNICTMVTTVKIIRHQRPDIIDEEDIR